MERRFNPAGKTLPRFPVSMNNSGVVLGVAIAYPAGRVEHLSQIPSLGNLYGPIFAQNSTAARINNEPPLLV
jgi:hypothetical protein